MHDAIDRLTKLAKAYELWGDFSRAVTYVEQSLAMVEAEGDVGAQGWHWRELGHLHRKLNQVRPAVEAYETSLTLVRSVENRAEEAGTLTDLGDLWRAVGDHTQAMEFYKQALDLAGAHHLAFKRPGR